MNLVDLLGKLSAAMNNPFAIHWTEYSARCLLFFTMGYGIVALTVTSSRKNRRRAETGYRFRRKKPRRRAGKKADADPQKST